MPIVTDINACEYGCLPQYGHYHARIFTPALGPITPETSDGYRAIEFARQLNLGGAPKGAPPSHGLLPWQRFFLLRALERHPDNPSLPRFRTIILLVSRQNGKSTIAVLLMTYWCALLGIKLVIVVAQDLSTSEKMWTSAGDILNKHPALRREFRGETLAAGRKEYRYSNGRKFQPKAANKKAGRGGSPGRVFLDELLTHENWEAWDAISSSTVAQENSQVLGASNAGSLKSVVLIHQREAAIEAIREGRTDTDIGIFEWSADEKWEITDPEAYRWANPGYGITITLAALRSKLASMPPGSFRAEHLCQTVLSLDSPVDAVAWEEMSDPVGDLRHLFKRAELHLGIEVGHDGEHVSLIGGGLAGDGRVRVGVLKSWSGKNAVSQCEKQLKQIVDTARPRTLTWYPGGPGGVLRVVMGTIRSTVKIELTGNKVASACASFAVQVSARTVVNGGEPLMLTQIAAAKSAPMGDGWRFEVKGIGAHVDALYATAGVVQQVRIAGASRAPKVITADEGNTE